jgi:DNA-directed RNA polymerase specialized sigma24 family protein
MAWCEFERRVAHALDALPENLRIVMVLAAIEGHNTREVAKLAGQPEGTVKSRLFLARKKLAQRLQCLVKNTPARRPTRRSASFAPHASLSCWRPR